MEKSFRNYLGKARFRKHGLGFCVSTLRSISDFPDVQTLEELCAFLEERAPGLIPAAKKVWDTGYVPWLEKAGVQDDKNKTEKSASRGTLAR